MTYSEVILAGSTPPSTNAARIRVLIADPHPVVREGLRVEIARQADMAVVGATDSGTEALQLARQQQPDVIILEVRLANLSGVQVARQIKQGKRPFSPTTPPHLLVFSSYVDKPYVWSMLAAGARGYLLKNDPPEQLCAAIRQLAAGQAALSPAVQTALLDLMPGLGQQLSHTETRILQLLAHGLTDDEIAQQLQIAAGTVRTHLNNTYRKLPWVRSRAEAVAWAWINRVTQP
ncbi:MAG: response regulator transcription factor [Anaerolineales bacterium]|nr:response regulator transcription factor [Anaerolineales bacterium]